MQNTKSKKTKFYRHLEGGLWQVGCLLGSRGFFRHNTTRGHWNKLAVRLNDSQLQGSVLEHPIRLQIISCTCVWQIKMSAHLSIRGRVLAFGLDFTGFMHLVDGCPTGSLKKCPFGSRVTSVVPNRATFLLWTAAQGNMSMTSDTGTKQPAPKEILVVIHTGQSMLRNCTVTPIFSMKHKLAVKI